MEEGSPSTIFRLPLTLIMDHTNSYSIVHPTLLETRSDDRAKVVAINEDITLNLVQTDVFSDSFVLSTAVNEDLLQREFDTSEIRRTLYHDEVRMAAVSMRDEDGVFELKGVIGETLRIEPLPFLERQANGQRPHRLFHAKDVSLNDKVTVSARTYNMANAARQSVTHLNEVIVEVLILCDTAFVDLFVTDADMIDYLAVTVAAVNLRYKPLRSPAIKFKIVGIVKLNKAVEKIFVKMNGSYMDAQPTLRGFMGFTYNKDLREADVKYLVTGMDMIEGMNSQMAGIAYVATLCSYDGVVIGEDRGGVYLGVDIMTHELAHSLGCVHDGDPPYHKPVGHKGSKRAECLPSLGYIMSPRRTITNLNRFEFSPCCQEQMKLVLSAVSASCLEETFNVTQVIPNLNTLPGHRLTIRDYCAKQQPNLEVASSTATTADTSCKIVCRYETKNKGFTHFKKYDALDGMSCGHGKRANQNEQELRRSFSVQCQPFDVWTRLRLSNISHLAETIYGWRFEAFPEPSETCICKLKSMEQNCTNGVCS